LTNLKIVDFTPDIWYLKVTNSAKHTLFWVPVSGEKNPKRNETGQNKQKRSGPKRNT